MLFFYIRHGQPIYDPDSLTEEGHRQAEALSKRLVTHGLDELYASTSNRAILTAQPTCEKLGKEAKLVDWANEGYAWEDTSVLQEDGSYAWCFASAKYKELFSSAKVRALGAKWYTHPAFADTNFARGVARVDKAVDEFFLSLGYEHDRENARYKVLKKQDNRVALFAHQGFGMMFLSSVLDIPYNDICVRFDMEWSGVTVIDFEEENGYVYPKMLQLSNDSHLYKEGLNVLYNGSIKV